jgi:DNA-binding response OmpR family regulator
MDTQPAGPARILVLARPALGRAVAATLGDAGYEVYRSPDAANLGAVAARVSPRLIIVALDLPWVDALAAARLLPADRRRVPVLLLGEPNGGTLVGGLPHLPLPVDPARLLAVAGDLLATAAPAPP